MKVRFENKISIIFEDSEALTAADYVAKKINYGFKIKDSFHEKIPKGEQGYYLLYKSNVKTFDK